jgi:hypothetical protein
MKTADQVKTMAFNAIDRCEPFAAECLLGELGEAPQLAVVEKPRIG